MRAFAISLLALCTFTLPSCQSKAARVKQLKDQYKAEYPIYWRECLDPGSAGAERLLTGKELTAEEIATLQPKKRERDAKCEAEADHLAQILTEFLKAQQ